jgi:hypothetical protein
VARPHCCKGVNYIPVKLPAEATHPIARLRDVLPRQAMHRLPLSPDGGGTHREPGGAREWRAACRSEILSYRPLTSRNNQRLSLGFRVQQKLFVLLIYFNHPLEAVPLFVVRKFPKVRKYFI